MRPLSIIVPLVAMSAAKVRVAGSGRSRHSPSTDRAIPVTPHHMVVGRP